MNRQGINELIQWKNRTKRKPLIVQGVRQVGKTWLIKEFGKSHFKELIYINFEKSERLKNIFIDDFNIKRIITILELETSNNINPNDTLIFFDEIQEANNGLTALKYFYEDAPQYYVVAAGSLLGTSIQKNTSFPVGKVDLMFLYPFSFCEFLSNINEERLADNIINNNWNILNHFHDKLINYLRLYYFIGGMPEAIAIYIETKDLQKVREVQEKILIGYENDFGKYPSTELIPRIRLIWNSLLAQLTKENKKFTYGLIAKGARGKEYELAINWLCNSGNLHMVNRVSKPAVPLIAYTDKDAFKLFFVDIGLLLALGRVDSKVILEKNKVLTEFKGAMTEQFVLQQLIYSGHKKNYYWSSDKGKAELDFLVQQENDIIPIEAKAEENLQSKSLRSYVEKFKPILAIRTSMSKYRKESWLTNIPLYSFTGKFEN